MSIVVGIDLGTTNSLVAYVRPGSRSARPEIIPNGHGHRLTPSVVGVDEAGRVHVGETAKRQLIVAPERTAAEMKRLMGTSTRVVLGGRSYTPQELSAFVLRRLKDDAERHLGERVDEAVVTVPAYFTDSQRQATKDAGELAGFRVERIINEPTAAALAYGIDHLEAEQYVLVYDLGGGTFDVSVLEMFDGVLDVKASAGNNQLGGSDFDRRIVDYLVAQFRRDHGVDLASDVRAMARLKAAAELAKHEVSTRETTTVMLPFLAHARGQPLSLECEFSREQLELLVEDLITSTLDPVDQALRDARLKPSQIHEVVLVGGSSRIPMVQAMLSDKFGRAPRRDVHPDEAIALGAAVQAALTSGALDRGGIMITDVCPFTLGVEVVGSVPGGGQRLPGMFSPILPRNTTIPVERTETYATTVDRQTHVDIKVFQGDSKLVRHNAFLDEYTIDGIPPAPAGQERIAVTFAYDVNGILRVTTRVLATGREASLTITRSAKRMSDEERSVARARVASEWSGVTTPPPTAPAAKTDPHIPIPPMGIDLGAVRALVTNVERRAAGMDDYGRARMLDLVAQMKRAAARDDAALVERLEGALADLLLELG